MIRTMIGLAATLAAVAGAAGPAAAVTGGSGPRGAAHSKLTLTYQAKVVHLTCRPAGGDHPRPVQACATLRDIDGNPARLKPGDAFCMLLYAPVTARVQGTWEGRSVRWQQTYGNSCEMARATGVLFQF